MTKCKHCFGILLLVVVSLVLTSCADDRIVGTWCSGNTEWRFGTDDSFALYQGGSLTSFGTYEIGVKTGKAKIKPFNGVEVIPGKNALTLYFDSDKNNRLTVYYDINGNSLTIGYDATGPKEFKRKY